MPARNDQGIRASRLSYELKDPPTRARAIREIGDALKAADGVVNRAAELLGVSPRQMRYWVSGVPELSKQTERIRDESGQITRPFK